MAEKIQDGMVLIGGKVYKTVALRVMEFRTDHPLWCIQTDMIHSVDTEVVTIKATIIDESGFTLATGHAEERRGQGNINTTSALENCETSAVGRAIAFLGYGGQNIASAEEVDRALEQQIDANFQKELVAHVQCVFANLESIQAVQGGIASGNYALAVEAWYELDKDTQRLLWRAPTKGGVFTTHERDVMKTDNDWSAARKEYYGSQDS